MTNSDPEALQQSAQNSQALVKDTQFPSILPHLLLLK